MPLSTNPSSSTHTFANNPPNPSKIKQIVQQPETLQLHYANPLTPIPLLQFTSAMRNAAGLFAPTWQDQTTTLPVIDLL